MDETNPTTVVIADDHAIVREGFVALCQSRPELKVIGQCSDGVEAVEMIRSLEPDFGLLDNHMPRLSGVEAIRRLKEGKTRTRLLILSISREERTVREALEAGADGYLLKDGPSRHLIDAINYVQDGGVYISPLLQRSVAFASRESAAEDPLHTLSPREHEVFTHLVSGLRAKEIAERLQISPKTVDTYRASLMRKLNVNDLVSLVKFAIDRGIIST